MEALETYTSVLALLSAALLLVAAGVALHAALTVRLERPERFLWLLVAGAAACLLAPELVYVRDEFDGVVVCANREGGFEEHDDETLIALGDHAGAVLESSNLRGELRRAYLSTVAMLAEALEVKDPFLRGHSEEVSSYVAAVADRMGVGRAAARSSCSARCCTTSARSGSASGSCTSPAS